MIARRRHPDGRQAFEPDETVEFSHLLDPVRTAPTLAIESGGIDLGPLRIEPKVVEPVVVEPEIEPVIVEPAAGLAPAEPSLEETLQPVAFVPAVEPVDFEAVVERLPEKTFEPDIEPDAEPATIDPVTEEIPVTPEIAEPDVAPTDEVAVAPAPVSRFSVDVMDDDRLPVRRTRRWLSLKH